VKQEVTDVDRLLELIQLLEEIGENRRLLADLSAEDRIRLIQAAGKVFNPDPAARRQLVKASVRKRINERIKRDEAQLHETGIRELRRKPVFTTPN
jgi:hypothetical protein